MVQSHVADAAGLPMVASQVWTDIARYRSSRRVPTHSSFMNGIEDPTELLDSNGQGLLMMQLSAVSSGE